MLEIIERILAALIILSLLTIIVILAFPVPPHPMPLPLPPLQPIAKPSAGYIVDEYLFVIILMVGAYFSVSLFVNLNQTLLLEKPKLTNYFSVPSWSALNSFIGNPHFQYSWLALFIVPPSIYLITDVLSHLKICLAVPLNARLSFFSALGFFLSNVIYSATTPKLTKQSMGFNLTDEQKEIYFLIIRWICYLSFMYGVFFLVFILLRTALFVAYADFPQSPSPPLVLQCTKQELSSANSMTASQCSCWQSKYGKEEAAMSKRSPENTTTHAAPASEGAQKSEH